MHSDDQENHSRMRELWVLWAECRTAQWVSRVNATRGVAPSSQAVYSVFLEWRQQAPAEYLPRDLDRSLAWRRQWACRWRERWEASMGNLKTGDLDTREILRQKARGLPRFPRWVVRSSHEAYERDLHHAGAACSSSWRPSLLPHSQAVP